MPAYSGSRDVVEADKFVFGDPDHLTFGYYAKEVAHIDVQNLMATVRLHQRPAHPIPVPQLMGQVFGDVEVDGGGLIRLGGTIIRVPPRGPAFALVRAGRPVSRGEHLHDRRRHHDGRAARCLGSDRPGSNQSARRRGGNLRTAARICESRQNIFPPQGEVMVKDMGEVSQERLAILFRSCVAGSLRFS
jgi:hypothetical protein